MVPHGLRYGGRRCIGSVERSCRARHRIESRVCCTHAVPTSRRQLGTLMILSTTANLMGCTSAVADDQLPWAQTDDRHAVTRQEQRCASNERDLSQEHLHTLHISCVWQHPMHPSGASCAKMVWQYSPPHCTHMPSGPYSK